ncbi:hypothetical protein AB0F18_02610 [Streptomyces sp. NPDC029216]|uniref:hypothetical protein n=1 Tax=Streptomyces sp. NPDC029216 TaxID=3154701 RepID=UPI0033DC8098
MDVLIVDTTRAINGTAADITNSVLASFPNPERLAFVTRADQDGELDQLPSDAAVKSLPGLPGDLDAAAAVAEFIRGISAELPDVAFIVYSFHRRVLAKDGDLAQLGQLIVTRSLREHVPQRAGQSNSAWPTQLMPLEDALDALEKALRRGQERPGHRRAVLKTELRTLLTMVEPRFDKDMYPLAGTPRLISILLHEAQERGMIRQFGREPQISIALGESVGPSTAARPASVPQPEEFAIQAVAPVPAPAVAPSATAAVTINVPAQAHSSKPVPELTRVSTTPSRSWEFADVLRQRRLGPYPEVRHILYEEIADVAALNGRTESPVLTVRALARQAVTATRQKAPDHFPRRNGDDLPKDKYDWRGLENFVVQVISRTELTLGSDGKPLPSDASIWATRQAPVRYPFPENIKITFDAEMIYEVVRTCQDVTPDDIVHLAGALLGGRGVQQTDHVEDVLDYLLQQGRIKGESDRLLSSEK